MHVHDLSAVEAIYHQQCSAAFRLGKAVPQKYATLVDTVKKQKLGHPSKSKHSGRPSLEDHTESFLKVTKSPIILWRMMMNRPQLITGLSKCLNSLRDLKQNHAITNR